MATTKQSYNKKVKGRNKSCAKKIKQQQKINLMTEKKKLQEKKGDDKKTRRRQQTSHINYLAIEKNKDKK